MIRSEDNGETWEVLVDLYNDFGSDAADFDAVIQMSNGYLLTLVLFVFDVEWDFGELLLSTDNGESWERFGFDLPPRFLPHEVIEDIHIPGRLYLSGIQKYEVELSTIQNFSYINDSLYLVVF